MFFPSRTWSRKSLNENRVVQDHIGMGAGGHAASGTDMLGLPPRASALGPHTAGGFFVI